jgi:histidinol phosphatase-like enzyme (inositol monophosphatase family)
MSCEKTPPLAERLDWAVQIAQEAGQATLAHFRRPGLAIERKADNSPVTVADRSAERLLRDRIAERFPEDAIVGEEFGASTGTSGYQWVLDPIDGTKSFIHGVPLYTTLVAVLTDDEPAVGVIHAPATGETVYAAIGGGCQYVDGPGKPTRPARVSQVGRLSDSLVLATDISSFEMRNSKNALDSYSRLQSAAGLTRTWGDGYGYLMVATGRAEAMIDPEMNVWDMAALLPVIEEAGGRFTDWNGLRTIQATDAVATNALVADEIRTYLK